MAITRTGTTPGKYTVCTSGTRPASPAVGDKVYETDTGYEKTYQGATDGWTQPWGVSWGQIQDVTWTTDTTVASSTVTDVTNATVTFTAVANRFYKYTLEIVGFSSVEEDLIEFAITDGSNVNKGSPVNLACRCGIASYFTTVPYVVKETGISGSITRKVRFWRQAGSGTVHFYADANVIAHLIVEDMGPNGAPS